MSNKNHKEEVKLEKLRELETTLGSHRGGIGHNPDKKEMLIVI
jgi:hypothetical protein